jgi:protein-S-isoprenylcysteine O-methyltransferase Ste14
MTTVHQYVLQTTSDLLLVEAIAAALFLAGLFVSFTRPLGLGTTNQGNHLQGLGFMVAGVGMAISSLGVHQTPQSNPLDWLWVVMLIGAALIAYLLVSTGTRIEEREQSAAIGRTYPARG